MSARVYLDEVLVGRLVLDEDTQRATFWFDAEYLSLPNRPVLGRYFEDRELSPRDPFRSADSQLHEFFLNALPEGALRKVLESGMRSRANDFDLLCRLGEDLPGCLRVVPDLLDAGEEHRVEAASNARDARGGADPLRFSLAGVQLKASVLRAEDRITLPLVGRGGNWIAKFPSAAFAELPENEFAMLTWAKGCGLNVPDCELVEVGEIDNLPDAFPRSGKALLIERFDRRGGQCIHQEDFSQVFGVHPLDKFMNQVPDEITYASLARLVDQLTRGQDTKEFLRRLAFMLLSGNSDAHIKNWSFVYQSSLHPRLSPAYDLVCVTAYGQEMLALAWGPPGDPNHTPQVLLSSVRREDFRVVAEGVGLREQDVFEVVDSFGALAASTWSTLRDLPDVPHRVRQAVDECIESGRLLSR